MPKKPSHEVLPHRLNVRLSDAEMSVYQAKMLAAGMNSSQFFRECLLTNRTHIVARAPASTSLKRILYVINKAGNNLNQLANAVNTEHVAERLSEITFMSVLDSLQSIELLLKAHLSRVD